jgi:hypothetical protein
MQKAPVTKQHPSVKDLHRPDLKANAGNDVDYSTDHVTSGPAKKNLPIGRTENHSLIKVKRKVKMATSKMATQIDITPATAGNTTGLHVHTPSGHSASEFNHATDNPSVTPAAASNAQGKAVKVAISGTDKQSVRFANPS